MLKLLFHCISFLVGLHLALVTQYALTQICPEFGTKEFSFVSVGLRLTNNEIAKDNGKIPSLGYRHDA
jgi:hypothetical protein